MARTMAAGAVLGSMVMLIGACATLPEERRAELEPLRAALTMPPQELQARSGGYRADLQLALSLLYEHGHGVQRDPVEAARLRKAATASRGLWPRGGKGPLDLSGEGYPRVSEPRYLVLEPQVVANRTYARALAAGDRSPKAIDVCGGEASYTDLAAAWGR